MPCTWTKQIMDHMYGRHIHGVHSMARKTQNKLGTLWKKAGTTCGTSPEKVEQVLKQSWTSLIWNKFAASLEQVWNLSGTSPDRSGNSLETVQRKPGTSLQQVQKQSGQRTKQVCMYSRQSTICSSVVVDLSVFVQGCFWTFQHFIWPNLEGLVS